jgi:SecD/SecF fusion protein
MKTTSFIRSAAPSPLRIALAALAVLVCIAPGCLAAEPEKPKAGNGETVLLFEPAVKAELTKDQSAKLIAVLDRRLNPGGLRSLFNKVKIEAMQGRQIRVTVPSTDPDRVTRVERLVDTLGSLEFRVLATDGRPTYKSYLERAKRLKDDEAELRDEKGELLAWWVPVEEGKEAEFRKIRDIATRTVKREGRERLEVLVVNDPYNVKGENLDRAFPSMDNRGRPSIGFAFNSIGGQKFSRLTGSHLPDPDKSLYYHMGIILDGKLWTAPSIRSAISDRGEISGAFSNEQVRELVDVLNAGALPVALRKVSPDKELPATPGKPGP